jgi:N-acetylmuramoyl-L-alanine amidase
VLQLTKLSQFIAFYTGVIFFFILLSVSTDPALAQTLNKVSVAKRNGDAGYVIRLHMNKAPRRFEITQPTAQGFEVKLTDPKISLSKLNISSFEYPIRSLRKVNLKGAAGLVVELTESEFFTSRIYLDSNKRDVLIALTKVEADVAYASAEKQKGFGWIQIVPKTSQTASQFTEKSPNGSSVSPNGNTPNGSRTVQLSENEAADIASADDRYRRLRDNMKFDVVVIDAGHGGHDPGAVGYSKKNQEKVIALKTALKLGELIQKNMPDVKVVYTRSDDTFIPLAERGRIANRAQGDLFISIHLNAAKNRAAFGTEVFFMGTSKSEDALEVMLRENSVVKLEEKTEDIVQMSPEQLFAYELANAGNMASSEKFASLIIDEFSNHAKRPTRGVKQAPFWVLYHASMPSVLVELGFISNLNEEAYMITEKGQNELAESMFFAVKRYREQYEKSMNVYAEPTPAPNPTPTQRASNQQ